jgi:Domain of unknown function (DUF4149)
MSSAVSVDAAGRSAANRASAAPQTLSSVHSILDVASRLTLSIWLGAMLFFSAVVAPSAFSALPTRQLAGTLVNSVLGKLEWLGLGAGVTLIVLMAATVIALGQSRRLAGRLALALPTLMTIDVAVSKFVVSAKLSAMRLLMGAEIEKLPLTDPLRMAFGDLHKYSVWLMGFNILAAVALLIAHQRLTGRRER